MIGTASDNEGDGIGDDDYNIDSETECPSLYERSNDELDSDSDSDSEEEGTKVDRTRVEATKKYVVRY